MVVKVKNINDIGILVRKIRLSRDLTQEKMAGLTGVGRRFLSELESGQKDTLEIGKVLQVLSRIGVRLTFESRDHEKK